MSTGTVLVIDSDREVRTLLRSMLKEEGFQVVCAPDGEKGLECFNAQQPDVIILELLLPGTDGYEVCHLIRRESSVPIIILSSKGDEVDKAIGFRLGADDYVTKPFSPSELALRVKAVVRRAKRRAHEASEGRSILHFGILMIDRRRYVVELKGRPVPLTTKEFELLWHLASHPEVVFTKGELIRSLWEPDTSVSPKNITILVSRLREKLNKCSPGRDFIKTVWGVGYKFDLAPDHRSGAGSVSQF